MYTMSLLREESQQAEREARERERRRKVKEIMEKAKADAKRIRDKVKHQRARWEAEERERQQAKREARERERQQAEHKTRAQKAAEFMKKKRAEMARIRAERERQQAEREADPRPAAANTGWHGGSVDGLVIKISLGGVEKSAMVPAARYRKRKGYTEHMAFWNGIKMHFKYTPADNTVEFIEWPTKGWETERTDIDLSVGRREIQILSIGGTKVNGLPYPSSRYSR